MEIKEIKKHFSKKYEIIELLGKGGFAEVYLAEDKMLERKVAIKILLTEHSNEPEMVKRFIREAKLYAKLEHENLISIYDTGMIGENAYLIMKYVRGSNLKSFIGSDRKTIERLLPNLIKSMGNVLSYIHSKGIIHRDIKPANILIEEGTDKTYLADFGIARSVSSKTLTQSGSIMGTPYYISPEQIKGTNIDFRSDIYALGATLYELVAAKPIYTGESSVEILYKHVNSQPVPVSRFAPYLSKEEKYIITKCLEKNPDKRFRDANEIAKLVDGRKSQKITKYLDSFEERSRRGKRSLYILFFLIIILISTYYFIFLGSGKEDSVDKTDNGRNILSNNHKSVDEKKIPVLKKKTKKDPQSDRTFNKQDEIKKKSKDNMNNPDKVNLKEKKKNTSPKKEKVLTGIPPKQDRSIISEMTGKKEPVKKNVKLRFSSYPASDVYWNEIKLGNTTQIFSKPFPPGLYTFRFRIEGYDTGEKTLEVKGDRDLSVHFKFKPYGFLTLTAKPFAEFLINNKSYGSNPIFKLKLPVGKYTVSAVKTGYKKETRQIEIKPLKSGYINFTMKKEEK